MATALMTPFVPGAGPPPTMIPMRLMGMTVGGERLPYGFIEPRYSKRSRKAPGVRWAASASRSTQAACAKSSRFESDHVGAGDSEPLTVGVHEAHPRLAGLWLFEIVEWNWHETSPLDADHGPAAAAEQESDGAVAEVAAVLGIEGNGVRASELIAHVLVGDRDAETTLAEPPLYLGFDLSREIDFGEPHVSVLVALDVLQLGELGRIELVDETLAQHRDAEVAPHRPSLDDRAFDDVAERGKRHVRRRVFLGDKRERGSGRLADAEREVARLAPHRDDDVPTASGPRVFHQVSYQLDSDVPGGLEAERGHVRRQRQVVVDRLRHVHAVDGAGRVFADVAQRKRRVIAANRHEVCDARLLQRLDHGPRRLGRGGRILARGPEHRPAEQVHPRHIVDRERPQPGRIPADEVLEPIANADDLEALVECLDGRGRDDGIDARGRSAADEDAEALR